MDALSFLRYEYLLNWLAVLLYIGATALFAYAVFFERAERLDWGVGLTALGLVPHSAAILLRWYVSGHGPYLNKFEGISSSVWMAMAVYLFLTLRMKHLKPFGLVVLPASFLLLAMALLETPEIQHLPPTFKTIWLIIHILFNKLSLAAILIALAAAIFYLRKEGQPNTPFNQKLPDLAHLDLSIYRFCGFAYIFWTINIGAGAIWAHNSWGRYWGWDPLEIWSLVTWLAFGIYMHLRRFHGLRGRKSAWMMIGCFALVVITLFIIPFITKTIHDEYLL